MYRENKPDDEDYLLGRRIDKVGEEQDHKEGSYSSLVQVFMTEIITWARHEKLVNYFAVWLAHCRSLPFCCCEFNLCCWHLQDGFGRQAIQRIFSGLIYICLGFQSSTNTDRTFLPKEHIDSALVQVVYVYFVDHYASITWMHSASHTRIHSGTQEIKSFLMASVSTPTSQYGNCWTHHHHLRDI